MCSFGSCQTRFEFLSQFRKVRNAFECFVTQVQTHLPKTKRVWPMKINVICTVYAINTAKNIMPAKQLKTLYYSLIHPYLNYRILLCGGTHKSYTHKLQVLQNKAIRVINNSKYNEFASPIFRKLIIMTFDNMYKLESCKFMYMNSKNGIPLP